MSKKFRRGHSRQHDRKFTEAVSDQSTMMDRMGTPARNTRNKPGYFEPLDIGTIKLRKQITPRTFGQELFWSNLLDDHPINICLGPAGTGKTYLTVAAAVKRLAEGEFDKVIVTRPAVESDEQLGFLPGGIDSKMLPYMMPIIDCLVDLVGGRSADLLFDRKVFEVRPFAFMRGSTFKRAFVIADEMQNSTPHQFKCLMTRIGEGSKLAISGDPTQSDLPKDIGNGLNDFLSRWHVDAVTNRVAPENFTIDQFCEKDIVRHPAVREVLRIYKSDSAAVYN